MSDETMTRTVKIHQKLASVFEPEQAQVLSEVVTEAFQDLVKTSDFSELKAIVGELAQAQHRTEQRVEELAQAQHRTEQRVEELATNLNILTKTVAQLARQVGGLSDTVGGDVEDIAQFMVTQVLQNELGWRVHTLERSWHTWGAKLEEIDLFGRATDPTRSEAQICIIGEAKVNLTYKEAQKFSYQVQRAQDHLSEEVFPLCFCYRARPDVQTFLKDHHIHLVFSYGKLVRP